MCIFSLYMHSDPILIHLLEFGSILSIFQGFSSERRKCAFFRFTRIPNLFSPICSSLVEFCPFFTDFRQKDVNAHFMLHMYSDAICKHLLEFGSLLVIFYEFSTNITSMCMFSLYMYSDDICSRLIHFRSFFTDFRQKHVYVHFFALHVFFSYLLAGGTSG